MGREDPIHPTRRTVVAGLPFGLSLTQSGGSPINSSERAPSLGNLFAEIDPYAKTIRPKLSFLEPEWKDLESWKASVRPRYRQLLNYDPPRPDFVAKTTEAKEKTGYKQEDFLFQTAPSIWAPASILIPKRQLKGRPAVVLLHDHGGFYYFGKDKMLEVDGGPAALTEFRNLIYEAGPTGPALARAGYVVLTIDAFYFGGRRLEPTSLPPGKARTFTGLRPGSDEFIRESNKLGHEYESLTAKTLFMAGTTWPGMLLWDDIRSVDYLLTRPEINPERVGCLGLSLGGFRAAHLAALHPKIRSSVVCCFMSTFPSMLRNDVEHHTWMTYVPGGAELLDLPDVASLAAPNWTLVQYGSHDPLFPLEGKRASAEKIKKVFAKAHVADRMEGKFYDAPHMLSRQMQKDALAWFAKTLG